MSKTTFEYSKCRIKDVKVETSVTHTGKSTVTGLDINGRKCMPTQRFWTSVQARFGFANNIFKYFPHEEVFNRISEVNPKDELRFCIQKTPNGDGTTSDIALAATNPSSAIVEYNDLLDLLARHGINIDNVDGGDLLSVARRESTMSAMAARAAEEMGIVEETLPEMKIPMLSYDSGVMRSVHSPRNTQPITIAGDLFHNQFVLDTPIDGFGKPSVYLMVMRQVCSNGAIAISPVFRSEISLGKGEDRFGYAINRAIEGYNNEEGYAALAQRFEVAAKSWVSINEVSKIHKLLVKLHLNNKLKTVNKAFTGMNAVAATSDSNGMVVDASPIMKSFSQLTGDLSRVYGFANIDALNVKRQRTLPTGAKMYDMLNFLSETATHHSTPLGNREIQALIGDIISSEYDLEGTVDKFGDWKDFLIKDSNSTEALAAAQSKFAK